MLSLSHFRKKYFYLWCCEISGDYTASFSFCVGHVLMLTTQNKRVFVPMTSAKICVGVPSQCMADASDELKSKAIPVTAP
jgi:hypothetical protein